jgi:Flp pilus assembly protein TadB
MENAPAESEETIMEKQENTINIIYSAEEQKEIDSIRAKYQPGEKKQPTNLDKLKKLDARVESKAMVSALSEGIISTLVLGVGMTCVLVWNQPVIGVIVGVLGLAGALYAWPLYQRCWRSSGKRLHRRSCG